MTNDNDNDFTIDAQTNVQNLDIIGRILVNASKGKPLDSMTALLCSTLLAECRVYSTRRDNDLVLMLKAIADNHHIPFTSNRPIEPKSR